MKKIIFFLFLLSLLFVFSKQVSALGFGSDQPFGGVVTMYPITGVVCPTGIGAFQITPVGISTAGPFLLPFTNTGLADFTLSVGQWVLGFYRPVPQPGGCVTTTTPPAPVPTFEVKREFQTSGFGL